MGLRKRKDVSRLLILPNGCPIHLIRPAVLLCEAVSTDGGRGRRRGCERGAASLRRNGGNAGSEKRKEEKIEHENRFFLGEVSFLASSHLKHSLASKDRARAHFSVLLLPLQITRSCRHE